MARREFKLPDPGEGLTEADIVTWTVAPGDEVKVNDIVVEIETAKSLVELPIPFAGVVSDLLVAEGDTVEVGTPIIAVDDGADADQASDPESSTDDEHDSRAPGGDSDDDAASPSDTAAESDSQMAGRTAVLVGYGVKTTDAVRRPRRGQAASEAPQNSTSVADQPRTRASDPATSATDIRALAKPPVRKLAKDLGVDLASITPTGAGGVVTRADVESAAQDGADTPRSAPASPTAAAPGGETRIPVKGVRKMTAQAMVASAFTAPHVTEWLTLDMTATMDLVDALKRDRAFREVKVTPLLILAKAVCLALKRHPDVNASWDEAAQEIVIKHDINLGIAAATPRGLIVPNIKSADRLPLVELAGALGDLTETARAGRTSPADMAGGTITITNVGVFGVDGGTPILNPGEAAILAFGSVSRRPWVVGAGADERIEPRWVTTLALSFDHRLIDGELGSRFLADVASLLSDPARAMVFA